MSFNIICPYCFKKMQDHEVLFRSEKVNLGEPEFIPDDYDDLEDFIARYRKADRDQILAKYRDWEFFAETEDPEYNAFWEKFNGTTEYNPADEVLQVKAYRRRIIDPANQAHQKYLRIQPTNEYFIRDDQGMVSQIELASGERCNRRVCRHCHNPLPDNYGKNNVKFATVVGITGAGKTVYLSQLLRRIKTYAVKVGLSAIVGGTAVATFLKNNSVAAKHPLPGSTPATRFQQPLFFEMVRDAGSHGRVTETFVLYDVAGEVFKESSLVTKFAPFIEHADGVIVLIDPMQFEVISGASMTGRELDDPTTALQTIHNIISHASGNEKCDVPMAVCLSKVDTEAVQSVIEQDLRTRLLDDVKGIPDAKGFNTPIFNAKEYAPIANGLRNFIQSNELVLAQLLQTNYSSYAYFAFTALGCDVEEGTADNGTKYQYPVGPVLPKRVEEPLLWLFYKLGYIGKNAALPGEIYCPECNSDNNYELPEDERIMRVKKGLFGKKDVYVNRCCKNCGHKWEYIPS